MLRHLAAVIALSLTATAAQAVSLVTGSNALSGTTSGLEPQLAGTVVVDEFNQVSFAGGDGTFTAQVRSRVVRADDGTYDFYWQITQSSYTGTDATALGSLRIGDFGVPIAGLNGNYRVDSLGDIGPQSAFVFDDPQSDYVNFIFTDGLRAGVDSKLFFLDTTATNYAKTAIFDLANVGQTSISDLFSTYAPAEVPEPSTYVLMLAGLLGLGWVARRRAG